jgi:hypothetical protein
MTFARSPGAVPALLMPVECQHRPGLREMEPQHPGAENIRRAALTKKISLSFSTRGLLDLQPWQPRARGDRRIPAYRTISSGRLCKQQGLVGPLD